MWPLRHAGITAVATGGQPACSVSRTAAAQAHQPPPGRRARPTSTWSRTCRSSAYLHGTDVDVEQELSRPYAYMSRGDLAAVGLRHHQPQGYRQGEKAHVIYTWNIENPELHTGLGALRGRYFKTHGRYYYVQAFQFAQGTPDADLGAIVFDVTGLPDSAKVKEVARIQRQGRPGRVPRHVRVQTFRWTRAALHVDVGAAATPRSSTWTSCWPVRPTRDWSAASTIRIRARANAHNIVGWLPRLLGRLRSRHAPGQVLRRGHRRILRVRHHASGRRRS